MTIFFILFLGKDGLYEIWIRDFWGMEKFTCRTVYKAKHERDSPELVDRKRTYMNCRFCCLTRNHSRANNAMPAQTRGHNEIYKKYKITSKTKVFTTVTASEHYLGIKCLVNICFNIFILKQCVLTIKFIWSKCFTSVLT